MNVNKRTILLIVLSALMISFISSQEGIPNAEELEQMMNEAKGGMEDYDHETELVDQINEVMGEMELTQNSQIDRATFKVFFTKIILQGQEAHGEEKVLFDKLIDRVVSSAPEVFNTNEIINYIDMNKIHTILNELMNDVGIDPNKIAENLKEFTQDGMDHTQDEQTTTEQNENTAEEDYSQEQDEEPTEVEGEEDGENVENETEDDDYVEDETENQDEDQVEDDQTEGEEEEEHKNDL